MSDRKLVDWQCQSWLTLLCSLVCFHIMISLLRVVVVFFLLHILPALPLAHPKIQENFTRFHSKEREVLSARKPVENWQRVSVGPHTAVWSAAHTATQFGTHTTHSHAQPHSIHQPGSLCPSAFLLRLFPDQSFQITNQGCGETVSLQEFPSSFLVRKCVFAMVIWWILRSFQRVSSSEFPFKHF